MFMALRTIGSPSAASLRRSTLANAPRLRRIFLNSRSSFSVVCPAREKNTTDGGIRFKFTFAANKIDITFLSVVYIDNTRKNDQGEATMRQFTIAAAAIAIAALFAAPASAERVDGGPIKQNGRCWQAQKGSDLGTWGTWAACPATASAVAAHKRVRGHRA